jgi:hypothetical protein
MRRLAMPLQTSVAESAAGGRTPREQAMIISKAVVIAVLRQRGQQVRADFVDRELPERIDSDQHGGLLATLHLDLAELADTPSE